MAKSYNPADAFRKAQRAKELKKNKEVRKKVRETQTVKRDTRELEAEIRSLKDKKDNASKSRIAELENELAYVVKTKEAYVKEHPEAKDKIFKPRGGGHRGAQEDGNGEEDENGASGSMSKGRLYDDEGRLRDPTRSAYYDKVYNPWGVPPPGMPYKERDGLGGTAGDDSDEEDDGDNSDDEIVMPEGPPPADTDAAADDDDSDADSDDIPLPSGPPPPKAAPPIPSGPAGWGGRPAPMAVPFHQPIHMGGPPGMPPPTPLLMGMPPPIHMGMPMGMPMQYPPFQQHQQQQPIYPGGPGQAGPSRQFRPPRGAAPGSIQDPLSDTPTQTYQGYRAGLPARPPPSSSSDGTISSGPIPAKLPSGAAPAEITAAPVLRDLRKETTVFVPRNLKRKAPAGGGAVGGRINAAPGGGVVDEEGDERVVRKMDGGLMGKLKGVLGPELGSGRAGLGQNGSTGGKSGADEDYEKFLAGLGDLT